MEEILLITRIRTLNKGNQALSAAWMAMLERAFPAWPVRVLERRPRNLLGYTLRELGRARDPMRELDTIAKRLAAMAPGPHHIGPPPPARFILDESIRPPARFVRLRQRLNLRGRLASAGLYAAEYRQRLAACQRASLVVVNPAGEFFPREPLAAFYHVLDAHVARTLGCRTAIVNHTMDITDPTLRRIIPAVYRGLDLVGFRDEKSVTSFRAMGGSLDNVVVTPDLALTIETAASPKSRPGVIALAINVPEASAGGYLNEWIRVVELLQRRAMTVELVSNEVPADLPFYDQLQARFPGLRVAGKGLDYDAYARLLGEYELVVSSRMHTAILAMIAGAPVVAVEGSSFKITGLFNELGLDQPVIDPTAPDWPQHVAERASAARGLRAELTASVRTQIANARERITQTLVPHLRAAVGRKS